MSLHPRLIALAALVVAAACTPAPECTTAADCDTGETCEASACVAAKAAIDLSFCAAIGAAAPTCRTAGQALNVTFDEAPTGAETVMRLRLQSTGTGPATVKAARLQALAGYALDGPTLPATIASGQAIEFTLKFRPTTLGTHDALVTFETDEPGDDRLVLAATGSAREGCALTMDPATHDFGDTEADSTVRRAFRLVNAGTSPCTLVGAPALANTVPFALENAPAANAEIRPGTPAVFQVKYAPNDAVGPDTDTLTVAYRGAAPETRTIQATLSGTPVAPPVCRLVRVGDPAVSFGSLEIGTSTTRTMEVRNTGGRPCTLANARVVGTQGAPFAVLDPPPATLEVGQTATIRVRFLPSTAGVYGTSGGVPAAALFVDSNDPASHPVGSCQLGPTTGPAGCLMWTLTGTGTPPPLTFEPARVDFGTTYVGCRSPSVSVALRNTTFDPVGVRTLAATPAPYSVLGPTLPMSLPAGTAQAFSVRFLPTTGGALNGTVTVESDLLDATGARRKFTLPLTGFATTAPTEIETLRQGPGPKADVLLVVDDSGSMQQKQGWLADAIGGLLSALNNASVDWHIGVVTTDMANPNRAGRLQGARIYMRGQDTETALANLIRGLGTGGSPDEKGLEAMKAAISEPLASGANTGFLRPDAQFATLVLSDEEDFSTGTPTTYTTFLDGLKGAGRAADTSLWAIVVRSGDACQFGADFGSRYLAVQAATGGQQASVCEPTWSGILENLGRSFGSLPLEFTIRGTPDPATMKVRVNGVAYPTPIAWRYAPETKRVIFGPAFAPPAHAEIQVEYREACP